MASEIQTIQREPWEPQFDALSTKQEDLVRQFCAEIAGPRGRPGSPPDPVRLLEMAQALYQAEVEDFAPPVGPDAVSAEAVAGEVLHHIDTMYPAMWEGVARLARTSVRNTIVRALTTRRNRA